MSSGAPHVFLTDFGLAKDGTGRGGGLSRLTETGETLGTPAYMSPEQARGELTELTPATDVWALGAVLYELLSGGRRAFEGETAAAVIGAVLAGTPPPLPPTAAGAEPLARACLQRTIALRPPGAPALRRECERVLAGEPLRYRPPRPVRAGLVLAVAVVAVAATAVGLWRATRPRTPPAAPPVDRAAAQAQRAWNLRIDDPAQAADQLAAALHAAPAHDEWRLRLGLLHWMLARPATALATWGAIPPNSAARPRAHLYRGLLLALAAMESHRNLAQALPDLEAVGPPGSPAARIAQAVITLGKHGGAAALPLLDGVPGWAAALVRAQCHFQREPQELDAALHELDAVLKAGVADSVALQLRASVRTRQGDTDRALADLDRVIALAPRSPYARYNRGHLREGRGDTAGARADYDAALAIDPELRKALERRATVLQDLGEIEAALADRRMVVRAHPDDAAAWGELARTLRDASRVREGLEAVERALALEPSSAALLHVRGQLHWMGLDIQRALADYNRALAADPNLLDALADRANLRRESGDLRGARADCAAALARDPNHPSAHYVLGELLRGEGRAEEALASMTRAVELKPDTPVFRLGRAVLLLSMGRFDAAAADIDRAADRLPAADSRLLQVQGFLHHAQHQWDAAAAKFRVFLQTYPDDPAADHIRRLLAECEGKSGAK